MADLTPEERQRIYEEEKARVEAREKIEAEKKKPRHGCLMLFGLFLGAIAIFYIVSSFTRTSTKPTPPKKESSIFISYDVLRRWTPGRSGTGLDLLVSPIATRVEVMQLANHLVNQYRSSGQVIIFIFDDRKAWANRDNSAYPQKEYFKHFLVSVMSPPNSPGESEVKWVAEGREEPPTEKK
jgi:hypothetical protein